MHTTLKVENGTYTNMHYANKQRDVDGDIITYYATFTYNNAWHDTETRIVSVQNDKVIAWQS